MLHQSIHLLLYWGGPSRRITHHKDKNQQDEHSLHGVFQQRILHGRLQPKSIPWGKLNRQKDHLLPWEPDPWAQEQAIMGDKHPEIKGTSFFAFVPKSLSHSILRTQCLCDKSLQAVHLDIFPEGIFGNYHVGRQIRHELSQHVGYIPQIEKPHQCRCGEVPNLWSRTQLVPRKSHCCLSSKKWACLCRMEKLNFHLWYLQKTKKGCEKFWTQLGGFAD